MDRLAAILALLLVIGGCAAKEQPVTHSADAQTCIGGFMAKRGLTPGRPASSHSATAESRAAIRLIVRVSAYSDMRTQAHLRSDLQRRDNVRRRSQPSAAMHRSKKERWLRLFCAPTECPLSTHCGHWDCVASSLHEPGFHWGGRSCAGRFSIPNRCTTESAFRAKCAGNWGDLSSVRAKPADVTPGKIVRTSGERMLLGRVELVGPDSAVVTGEYGSLRFPLQAFGEWCDGSLLLRTSQHKFRKLVEQLSH